MFRTVRYTLAIASLLTLGSVFASPLLRNLGFENSGGAIFTLFFPICHQLPDRSFHWSGNPLPLCARCTGLLAGFTLCSLAACAGCRDEPPRLPPRSWIAAAIALLVIDATAPWIGLVANTHLTRLLSGGLMGCIVAACATVGIVELVEMIRSPEDRKANS